MSRHNFSVVPRAEIPRSVFDRSHGYKTTFNSGYLVPVYVDEVLPGDTINLSMGCFARLATPIVPVMDNMYIDSFFFFVPERLLLAIENSDGGIGWENVMGQQTQGDTDPVSPDLTIPYVQFDAAGVTQQNIVGSIYDYFGLPTTDLSTYGTTVGGVPIPGIRAGPFRAYNMIWNEWFRDENLQDYVPWNRGNGPDDADDYVLLRRGKRKDYFSSSLPWPQKALNPVTIPLAGTATGSITSGGHAYATSIVDASNHAHTQGVLEQNAAAGAGAPYVLGGSANTNSLGAHDPLAIDVPLGGQAVSVNLSTATSESINALRQAFAIQRLYERDARGGSRYTEILRSHFGVISPDSRLQRPEYLGGGSNNITMHPVVQSSGTGASGTTKGLGTLGAFSTATLNRNGFVKSFVEHGIVIGLVSVRADLNYQQGLNKMWTRSKRLDFYWPALSHIGEQSVLNYEIMCQGAGHETDDMGVFGYQERFAEMRHFPSVITGQFRSTYTTPLDMWHLAQKFTTLPVLGDDYIQDTPPFQRVVAVQAPYPEFLFDAYFQIRHARPLPVYGVPGLIDHF